jgi:hypothetical protein
LIFNHRFEVKLNPRNCLSWGRATALFCRLTLSFSLTLDDQF